MKSIGLCSHYSRQGDWAFNYAFGLAEAKDIQLNIFHWMESPFRFRREYVYSDENKEKIERVTDELKSKKELELREYYESRLGDFVKVGFKLCEGNEGSELAKCLRDDKYDLLIMGYVEEGADFGGQVVEKFAAKFKAPVIMVGPNKPNSFHLNQQAADIVDQLNIKEGEWTLVKS